MYMYVVDLIYEYMNILYNYYMYRVNFFYMLNKEFENL